MNIISKIRERFNFKRDRVKKGYAYSDTFDINYWFLNTIVPMLKDFNKDRVGFPCNKTDEEWGAIIDRMIYCFTEANEDTYSRKEEYYSIIKELGENDTDEQLTEEQIKELDVKRMKKLDEIDEYRNNMKNEAFELFREYFWELWW